MNRQSHLSPASDKLFDLSMIEKMCRGNKDTILKMINTFIRTITDAVEELKQACQKNDFLTIQKTAHRIKPTLAIYGIAKLEQEICQMEKLEEEPGNINRLGIWMEKLDNILASVIRQLKTDFLIN